MNACTVIVNVFCRVLDRVINRHVEMNRQQLDEVSIQTTQDNTCVYGFLKNEASYNLFLIAMLVLGKNAPPSGSSS